MDITDVWQNIISEVQVSVSALVYDLWIKTLTPLCIVSEKLILLADSVANRNLTERRFHSVIAAAAKKQYPDIVSDIQIISPDEEEMFREFVLEQNLELKERENNEQSAFIPKYTFENFVIGKSNEFVTAACKAVADNPGKRYNPLFIYGGVGLGKTHLMHAIGNKIRSTSPELKCTYVSCEHFTNSLIEALRDSDKTDKMKRFRARYRNIDVLMIDDIQFIAKTVSTQEELFHTFNDLYFLDKQIIITSDRPPKEISPLEERLRTRFEGGLIADIQTPDLETRIAILQKKIKQEKYHVPDGVVNIIAEKVTTNVREMEGLLTKVISYASLTGRSADDPYVINEAFKDFSDDRREMITVDRIIECVCEFYKVTREDLVGKKKNKEIVEPRQVCIYLITELLPMPLTGIGQVFGGRDHTTIMHARDKIADQLRIPGSKLQPEVRDINDMLLNR